MAIRPFALPPLPAAASACANAAGASNITVVIAVNNIPSFLIICTASLVLPQLPPGGGSRTPCSRAHTGAANLFVLVCGRQTEIDGRKNRENVRLHDGDE